MRFQVGYVRLQIQKKIIAGPFEFLKGQNVKHNYSHAFSSETNFSKEVTMID